jgi:hypothetical protein
MGTEAPGSTAEPILMLRRREKSLAAAANWNHDSLDDPPRA